MKIVLYNYRELEERDARQLKVWKVWHILLYAAIAILGLLNFTFLENIKQFVNGHCILYPNQLAFQTIEVEVLKDVRQFSIESYAQATGQNASEFAQTAQENYKLIDTDSAQSDKSENEKSREKRQIFYRSLTRDFETTAEDGNSTILIGNYSHRLELDTVNTFFVKDDDCQYAEYMPIMSTIVAMVWMVLFTMCPSGGRPRAGLTQPWSVLTPALFFAFILVILTGVSFTQTNGGIQAFCAAFINETNTTACSAVEEYIPPHNSSLGFANTVYLTRAASAAVWAGWACVAALLMARCLRGADFAVRRTEVYLKSDQGQKITPHLRKSPRRSQPSSPTSRIISSPFPDDVSVKSEPTCTSQLVLASVEQESELASRAALTNGKQDGVELLEMTYP